MFIYDIVIYSIFYMLTLYIKSKFLRTLKSGFLFDFFLKKAATIVLRWNFIAYNIYFSEKFIVEYCFLRLTRLTNMLFMFVDLFSNEYVIRVLVISLLVIFFILFVTFMLGLHLNMNIYYLFCDLIFISTAFYFFIFLATSAVFSFYPNFLKKSVMLNISKINFFFLLIFFLFFTYKFVLSYYVTQHTPMVSEYFFNQIFSDVLVILAIVVSFISWLYLSERHIFQNMFLNNYLVIFFFCTVNMVYTNNLLTMFIFFEFIFIPSIYFAYKLSYVKKAQKTVEFLLVWTLTGSMISLSAFSILTYLCSSANIDVLYCTNLSILEANFLTFLFFFGFGVKIPIWPLYFWLTKVHVEAPTGFSMFLSGFLVKTAFFCFSQVFFLLNVHALLFFYFGLVAWGILDASIRMWSTVDIKKLIALATIQEMNMILLFMLSLLNSNYLILNLFLLLHGILSIFFFYLVELTYKLYQTRSLLNVHGAQVFQKFHILVWVGLLTYRGFPVFVKFLIEWEFFSVLWVQLNIFGFIIFFLISFIGVIGFCKNWFIILYGANTYNISSALIVQKDLVVGFGLTALFVFFIFFLNLF